MSERQFLGRYGRTEAICEATSLLMEEYHLDAAQAVAQLVKVSKEQNDSLEAAARMCVAAALCGERLPGAPEPAGDEPHHRRVRTKRGRHRVRTAVA